VSFFKKRLSAKKGIFQKAKAAFNGDALGFVDSKHGLSRELGGGTTDWWRE
jgi:hypothetical protein